MTGRTHQAWHFAAILLTLLVPLLAACSSDPAPMPAAATHSAAPGTGTPETISPQLPPPQTPKPDACYLLDHTEALAPTSSEAAVRCKRRHTSQTYHVGTLNLVEDGHLLAVDSARAEAQASTTCRARLVDHLGGDPRLSVLNPIWFTPTLDESDAGADWFRCDVVAVAGPQQLAALPAQTKNLLGSAAGQAQFGLCSTAAPTDTDAHQVPCADPHQWRAILAIDLPGAGYPTRRQATTAMQTACHDAAREVATDPLNVTWSEARPTKEQWQAGRHYGLCWAPV